MAETATQPRVLVAFGPATVASPTYRPKQYRDMENALAAACRGRPPWLLHMLEPPSHLMSPDYYGDDEDDAIGLAEIKTRLQSNEYHNNVPRFVQDVHRIFQKSIGAHLKNDVGEALHSMHKVFLQHCDKVFPTLTVPTARLDAEVNQSRPGRQRADASKDPREGATSKSSKKQNSPPELGSPVAKRPKKPES